MAGKIKFKKANRGKNMMRNVDVSNLERADTELPMQLDDARASLQASLLEVAISGPAG